MRLPRPLVLVAIGVGALAVLAGVFFASIRLQPAGQDAVATPTRTVTVTLTPTATPTPTPTPTPSPGSVGAVGPVAPGDHSWTELLGGECVSPFVSPWEARFTVVDCAQPHAAQLVARASINPDPAAGYPGDAAVTAGLGLACTAPSVLDLAAAAGYPDLQWQASYPVSAEQWAAGMHDYSCFVSRSTGAPFDPGSLIPAG